MESREAQLEHKEKRLAEEKTFYEQQMKQLETELERLREELLASKREAGHKLAGLSQVSFTADWRLVISDWFHFSGSRQSDRGGPQCSPE